MSSMIEVVVTNEHSYSVNTDELQRVVNRVFLVAGVTIAQIGVHIVDEPTMVQLNQQYKHHQGATDVLSFVLHDPEQPTPAFLETEATESQYGDIFLCYPVIANEVQEDDFEDSSDLEEAIQERLEFLTEHGCLHLLGVHHE